MPEGKGKVEYEMILKSFFFDVSLVFEDILRSFTWHRHSPIILKYTLIHLQIHILFNDCKVFYLTDPDAAKQEKSLIPPAFIIYGSLFPVYVRCAACLFQSSMFADIAAVLFCKLQGPHVQRLP